MNFTGLGLAVFMLGAIGFGFFWVIKLEYYLGAHIWKAVLVVGLLVCLASLLLPDFLTSALLGIFGGSVVWGATELPGQEKRVQRGLFPANPRRSMNKVDVVARAPGEATASDEPEDCFVAKSADARNAARNDIKADKEQP